MNCPICLEELDLEIGNVVNTKCRCKEGQKFHYECIGRWLIEKSTCPMCNENLLDYEENEPIIQEIIKDFNVDREYLTPEIEIEPENNTILNLLNLMYILLCILSAFLGAFIGDYITNNDNHN